MRRILTLLDVWITAVRRDQSETRSHTPIVGAARRSDGSLVVKVAPLARWTRKDTWRHLFERELPYNRLLGERSGRWAGQTKTECGIHNL